MNVIKKLIPFVSLLMFAAMAQANDMGQVSFICNFTGGAAPAQNFVFYKTFGSSEEGWITTPAGLLFSAKSSTLGQVETISWTFPGTADVLDLVIDFTQDQCRPGATYSVNGSPSAKGSCFSNSGAC